MRHWMLIPSLILVITAGRFASAADTGPVVSVGIFSGRRLAACSVTSQSALQVRTSDQTEPVEVPPGVKLAFTAVGNEVRATRSDRQPLVLPPDSPAEAAAGTESASFIVSSPTLVRVTTAGSRARSYRGTITAAAHAGQLVLINRLGLEDYLRGVVPAEMPAGFAPEALKAQAIAARSYALTRLNRHQADGYELCDAVHCQVYLGAGGEDTRVDAAVRDSAGLALTYQGRPISAVYHDTCGGETSASEEAWATKTATPYLRPVDDTDGGVPLCAASPKAHWKRTISQRKLAASLATYGVVAPFTLIRPVGCEDGTRPDAYRFIGPAGEWRVPAGPLRTAVIRSAGPDALPSADFVASINGDTIALTGWGSGHGVGLCQWGANGLAKRGRSATEILAHYYAGTKVEAAVAQLAAKPRAGG